ncbi:laminin-like protein epi-1 [Antedon mediterranea]|uniref:laminin-like protein epi-1 n=1 Tax=Antedon mediterranea TaxID=105859 RepID=UPI003AF5A778
MSSKITFAICVCFLGVGMIQCQNQALSPPSFNIAQGKKISATSTCGDQGDELYCKITGNTGDGFRPSEKDIIVNGQYCDSCEMTDLLSRHPVEYAIDGTERWWQSPPLSRGSTYNAVNVTIDLGQSYHVAYVIVKFANSPRPGVWILEKSSDFGNTYEPWQYFADSESDCVQSFGMNSTVQLTADDQVICTTAYSEIVPLEDGEIVVSLINGRPGANDFYASDALKGFTRATNVRLRLLQTKTLLGHLMAKQQQDPTVTRRYYYSIKDISIGGRCLCNGHADRCDTPVPGQPGRIMCTCSHNTCGPECQECCPGFVQKKWLPATLQTANECEPCNCFGHATSCYYDEDVDHRRESLDIYGNYSGGGVCIDCQDNTTGVNCNECKPGYFRASNTHLTSSSICQRCNCASYLYTGSCAPLTGKCECKPQYAGEMCNECSLGHYDYPECKECRCNVNGTVNAECQAQAGQCQCKQNFRGLQCDKCSLGYYKFPSCILCECNVYGRLDMVCDEGTGECRCRRDFAGRACDQCAEGFYGFPNCLPCKCHPEGTEGAVCESVEGKCKCKRNFAGTICDSCTNDFYDFPNCKPCDCNSVGTGGVSQCYSNGQCQCLPNYNGDKCKSCSRGYYGYPDCIACDCDPDGSKLRQNCDRVTGQCPCSSNYIGRDCRRCALGFYNFPFCEECNCAPSGVQEHLLDQPLGGCGAQTNGACLCKDNVVGRSCDECKELYWNLQLTNPSGCEDCMCFTPGTTSTSQACQMNTGQCRCKLLVTGRQCTECQDGSYELAGRNIFGCTACECDVGGAINNMCDKSSGQCTCRPRIKGKNCNEPERAHFFYDLYQFRFEIEEGRSTVGGHVRIGYDESVFDNFSYLGYAIMSESTQPSVVVSVDVINHELYRIILRYVHTGSEIIRGRIKLTPIDPTIGSEQIVSVIFLPGAGPQLVTVEGGNNISPFVLNPGRWHATIEATGGVLLDYLVLLPSAYYEASTLKQQVTDPCQAGQHQILCNRFVYPQVDQYEVVLGQAGYYYTSDGAREPTRLFTNNTILLELGVPQMALVDREQTMLSLSFPISVAGEYVLIMEYYGGGTGMSINTIDVITEQDQVNGFVATYECEYLCRSVVMDMANRVNVFVLPEEVFEIKFTQHQLLGFVAVSSIVAIPVEMWNFDLVTPTLQCVRSSNKKCLSSTYPDVTSVKVVVDEVVDSPLPPNILDTNAKLYYMNSNSGKTELLLKDVRLTDGQYMFIVHYYQPYYSAYNVNFDIIGDTKQSGTFKAKYCPHVVGCRALVTTTDSSEIFNLLEGVFMFKVSLETVDTRDIWIDYVLVVPKEVFNYELLALSNQDRAEDFITECGRQEFYISPSATGFCRNSVFSLSSYYNNGAEQCQCNLHGSLDYFCNELGGQCPCRKQFTGRQCDRCKIGYFDFPHCRDCECLSGVCNDVSGVCICPPNVIGDSCDGCQENYFGYDPIAGCIECECDDRGTEGDINKCDRVSGQCNCKPNVGGRRCDQCLPGFHSYPFCSVCNCQLPGTVERVCDDVSADCICKENVVGEFCDECSRNTFHLVERNSKGCTSCFCFGITSDCAASTNLYRQQVNSMSGWNVTKPSDSEIVKNDDTLTWYARNTANNDDPITVYWIAPTEYLGNKITSYGGQLRYTVYYRTDASNPPISIRRPDVILSGSNLQITYSNIYEPNQQGQVVALDILEDNFHYSLGGGQVTREDLMMVLADLRMLQIRAKYYTSMQYSSLKNVSLDIATNQGTEMVYSVEQCNCPVGYTGLSCEDCGDGYYRVEAGAFRGRCIPCECNGHSDQCDKETGECIGCQHNTEGRTCDGCRLGYYTDSKENSTSPCQLCACPQAIEGNSFAQSCSVSGTVTTCNCLPGYTGVRCSQCEYNYFGSPAELGGSCQPCFCNGNTDTNRVQRYCHTLTGECYCDTGFDGFHCEKCADDYYGDPVNLHNCQECECNTCGVSRCDNSTGGCVCKPNVIGDKCSGCRPDTWGFSSCEGCQMCDCGVASVTSECNMETGVCTCLPGVGGEKCDQCLRGFWDYGPAGCTECFCPDLLECDKTTGECICPEGAIGEDCDTCEERYTLTKRGCVACDTCVHILLDDIDKMLLDINMTIPGEIPLGPADLDRLDRLNDTLWNELKPGVAQVRVNNTLLEVEMAEVEKLLEETIEKADKVDKQAKKNKNEADIFLPLAEDVKQRAINLEKFINDSYTNLHGMIEKSENRNNTDVQDGLHDLQEARRIVNELEGRNFTELDQAASKEQVAADLLLDIVNNLNQDADAFLMHLMNVSSQLENSADKLEDLINQSKNASQLVVDARKLNNENEVLRENGQLVVRKSNRLFANGTEKIEKSWDLLAQARLYLNDANASNAELARDYTRLIGGIRRLEPSVERLEAALEGKEELVFEAEEHAKNLTMDAAILVDLAKTGIEYAELADKAARAYSDIIDAINNAKKSANDSKTAAEIALQQSNDLNAEKALKKSRRHLKNAQDAKAEITEDLVPQFAGLSDSIQELKDNISMVEYLLNMIRDEIKNLPKVDSEVAKKALNLSTEAEKTAEDVKLTVDDIKSDIIANQLLLKHIQANINSSTDVLDAVEKKLTDVGGYKSTIKTLTPQVTNIADTIDQSKKNISLDINAIKEKVQAARSAAYRIRLAMQFSDATSYTKIRPSSDMAKPSTVSKLSFYLNLNTTINIAEGLLFFIGGPTKQDNFLAAELENRKLKITYRLASSDSPSVVLSTFDVRNDKWSEVSIKRVGNGVTGSVEGVGSFNGTFQDRTTVLTLAKDGVVYIGGAPTTYAGIPDILTRKSFQGSLENIYYNNEYIPFWNYEEASNIQPTYTKEVSEMAEDEKYKASKGKATFTGKSFAQFEKIKLSFKNSYRVELTFKSNSLNGLLFYIGDQNMFYAVSLREGYIILQLNSGTSGYVEVVSTSKHNTGISTFIETVVYNNVATLTIGGIQNRQSYTSSSEEAELPFYIGGVHSQEDVSQSNVTTQGFIGCIQNVYVDGSTRVFSEGVVKYSSLALGCIPEQPIGLIGFPKAGYVKMPITIDVEFTLLLSFRTVKTSGTLFTMVPNEITSLAVRIVDSNIVVETSIEADWRSAQQNVSDGNWHFIRLEKTARKLDLFLDDDNFGRVDKANNWIIDVAEYSYIGGGPGNSEPFIGCISDFVINNQVQDFVNEVEEKNVEHRICPFTYGAANAIPPEKLEEVVDTTSTAAPETCALLPPSGEGTTDEGIQFGDEENSRIQLNDISVFKNGLSRSGSIKMAIKTTQEAGILYYANSTKRDFLSVYLANGKVVFSFDCGEGPIVIINPIYVSDGSWHKIGAYRKSMVGTLTVDDSSSSGRNGTAKDINRILAPQYVGGILQQSIKYVPLSSQVSFVGCIKDFSITPNKKTPVTLADQSPQRVGVSACRGPSEQGVFIHDGYVILDQNVNVGKNFVAAFQMKPRVTEGVLLSVRTGDKFLVVEMTEGDVYVRASNSQEPFETSTNSLGTILCDGQWHSVRVEKIRHVIDLTVDGVVTSVKLKNAKSIRTDDPLYIGGIPDTEPGDHINSAKAFVGCLRDITINGDLIAMDGKESSGKISLNFCPLD